MRMFPLRYSTSLETFVGLVMIQSPLSGGGKSPSPLAWATVNSIPMDPLDSRMTISIAASFCAASLIWYIFITPGLSGIGIVLMVSILTAGMVRG